MNLDLTRLMDKLVPEPDGESPLVLRIGTVMAINADGSLDVQISGVTVAGVSRLTGASMTIGGTVQILSYRGGLLVIGSVATSPSSGGRGLWARVSSTVNSAAIGTSPTAVLTTPSKTFLKNRIYELKMSGAVVTATSGGSFANFSAFRTVANTLLGEFHRIPITGSNANYRAGAAGVYFTPGSVDVTAQISLLMSHSAGTVTHIGTSQTPRFFEVWDIGDISNTNFDNIPVW